MRESGSEAGDGLGAAGPELAFEVGDERWAEVRVAVRQPNLERVGLLGRFWWFADDVEVEQHGVGAHESGPVMPPALPGRCLSGPARRSELVEIADGERFEGAAGLDQEPADRLRRGPLGLDLSEPDYDGGVAEPGHVGLEAGTFDLTPKARQLLGGEPVPTRTEPPLDHQEHEQRHRRRRQVQPCRQGLVGPVLRVWPTGQERSCCPVRCRVPSARRCLVGPPRRQHAIGRRDRRDLRRWRVGGRGQHRTRLSRGWGPNGCNGQWCRCARDPTGPASRPDRHQPRPARSRTCAATRADAQP